MAKYGMVINISRCNGCYNCFLACRDEYCGNDYPPYSLAQPFTGHFWMRIIERERTISQGKGSLYPGTMYAV